MSETAEVAATGLRERKKQRTRWALIRAALDLFLAQGYEATTIDEIVATVDVSQRTFFRYFASKEDVVLSLMKEYDRVFIAALVARPAEEGPIASLVVSLRGVLDAVNASEDEDAARFAKVRDMVDQNPGLAVAQFRYFCELEQELAAIIARRMGADPVTDPRPALIVASFLSVVRVAFESCAREGITRPDQMAARVDETFALASDTIPRVWSTG